MLPFKFGVGSRIETVTRESMTRQLILVGLLALLGAGLVIVMVVVGDSSTAKAAKRNYPNSAAQYNYIPVSADTELLPGQRQLMMEDENGRETPGPIFDAPVPINFASPSDTPGTYYQRLRDEAVEQGALSPLEDAEYRQLDTHTKGPAFKLDAEVAVDLYDPKIDPRREMVHGEKIPLPGTSEKNPLYHFPIQMETPWIAFDGLCRDVAAASPESIAAADNGTAWIAATYGEAVNALRGKVFTIEGVLWSLREQPLRREVVYKGQKTSTAYYGIVAYLRRGIGPEPAWVNDCAAFTVFELPDSLKKHALKPGQTPHQDDSLSAGTVAVRMTGAWFRRIAYYEQVAELEVVHESAKDEPFKGKYFTEGYMPWLVGQVAQETKADFAWLKSARDIVTQYTEDTPATDTDNLYRNRFDEAGYYLSLYLLRNPGADSNQEVTELNLRRLQEPFHRAKYRGARVKVKGTMWSGYQPVIMPPNISGLRSVWRVYVLDALQKSEEDEMHMWFVDTLEPPMEMRGKAQVMLEGQYYRSQIYWAKIRQETVPVTRPVVVTKKLEPLDIKQIASETPGIDVTVVGIVICSIAGVLVVLFVLGQMERRNTAKFEEETLATVRTRMTAARNRIAKQRAQHAGAPPSPQAAAPQAQQTPGADSASSATSSSPPGPTQQPPATP